jgi:8-oxo-dGTP pyrophosphatase MutT (NUDIX family)
MERMTFLREISAGGVVFRLQRAEPEILLVQDRFGRWTFPKGKKEAGETDEQTALREISEETRITGRIEQKLTTTGYTYHHPEHGQVEKQVSYFLVAALSDDAQPQVEEVRAVEWCPLLVADQLLAESGYQNNQPVYQLAKEALLNIF